MAISMNSDHTRDVHVISDPAALRIVAHPLRLRILEYLRTNAGAAQSVKEIATALNTSQTRLYYHVNLLVEHGLIHVAETHLVSGIVERRYRVTAFRLSFDRSLLTGSDPDDGLDVWLSFVLDEVRSEIHRALDAGLIDLDRSGDDQIKPRQLVLGRKWLSLTPAELAEFSRRFDALKDDFMNGDPDTIQRDPRPDATLYEIVVGFYPIVPPAPPPPVSPDEATS
jgi:DNA-binding transcriptional ArsR family regulator